ncbi:MAG: SDR family oxidoreductase [bacterium]|nr:SDR family oxidoreductase [bacterium]
MASNRVAFVVGASRGIGRGCARHLAQAGFDIAVAARTLHEGSEPGGLPGSLDTVVSEIESRGRSALACRMDLLDRASCRAAIERTLDEFGRIDVLVNSGIDHGEGMKCFADTPIEDYDRAFSTNVTAPLLLIQNVLPSMREQGGGIVINISSGAGQNETRDLPGAGGWPLLYSITKAAINRATTGMAKELRAQKIAVINLEPGVVATERMVEVTSREGIAGAGGVSVDVPGSVCAYLASHQNPMSFSGRTVDAPQFCVWAGLIDGTTLPFPYGPAAWGAPPEIAIAGQTTGVGGGVPVPPAPPDAT